METLKSMEKKTHDCLEMYVQKKINMLMMLKGLQLRTIEMGCYVCPTCRAQSVKIVFDMKIRLKKKNNKEPLQHFCSGFDFRFSGASATVFS